MGVPTSKKTTPAMSQRIPNGSVFLSQQREKGTISLRYQLAEDGCTESQLAIAKSLFEQKVNNREERDTNARIAIHWLLRAAEKGNTEAICLLKYCCDTGIGISSKNFFLVEKYLQLSETEVIARRVSYNLFSVIMSDTEETIADELFQEKVELLLNEAETVKESDLNSSDYSDNFLVPETVIIKNAETPITKSIEAPTTTTVDEPSVSVGDVITSVHQCLEGSLPVVALKRVAQYEQYNKLFSLKYAHKLSGICRGALLILLKDFGSLNVLFTVLLYILILHIFTNIYNIEKFDSIFSCSLISLILMISCSSYIINIHIGFFNINRWLDLIKHFEKTIQTDDIKQTFLRKTFFPFLVFFPASVAFNACFPFGSLKCFYNNLFVYSVLMFVLLDRTIKSQRKYVNISLLLNMLLIINTGNFLNDVDFGWLNVFNYHVSVKIGGPYELNINWLSCLILPTIPFVYWKMAFGGEKNGWQLVFIPHLLCLTWVNLATNFYVACETNDITWSFCFWLAVLIFTSYFGAIPSLIFALTIKYICTSNLWPINVSNFCFIIFLFVSFFVCSILVCKIIETSGKILFSCMLIFCAITIFVQSNSSAYISNLSPPISWGKYEMFCHRNAWYQSNTAEVETACLPLKGMKIAVDGTVMAIDIIDIDNNVDYYISMLPSLFSRWLIYAFGDNLCAEENKSPINRDRCMLYKSMNINPYQLHNWSSYKYRIMLEVASRTSPEIMLKTDTTCSSFIRKLKEGDSLHVEGVLDAGVGSTMPEILLQNATCNSCYDKISCKTLYDAKTLFNTSASFCHLVKVYFSPFIHCSI